MSKRRSKKKDEDHIVIVKPLAYYKMLVHILRFGNKARDPSTFKEVMGMLIGHLEGDGVIKNVIVEDAVPISHGGSIEVAFSAEDYGTFALVDEEAFAQGKHAVGWYHSHPSLRIFWSSTDIQNQLFWQTANNPSGIGIVFGLATFGYKVITTVGKKITELTPSRGFSAEIAAATTVVLASFTGIPVSTTHTLVGAVLGVGFARGIGAIDLRVVGNIFMSWVVTLPAGAFLAIIFFYMFKGMFG